MADNYQIDLTLEEIFGTGISSIEQTTVSTIPGGANVWTVTLTNGNSYDFTVLNGTAGGDPIPALTGSAMTDTSAVYLYLGSETGYTFGHWYYYDGTWKDGGAYGAKGDKGDDGFSPTASVSKSGTTTTITITDENGTTTAQVEDGVAPEEMIAEKVSDWLDENITVTTGVVIDTSLQVAGAAADAKIVGDELSDLKSQLTNGVPYAVKQAIDNILQNVAFKNNDVYTSDLATVHTWATSVNVTSISAVYTQSGTVYDTDSLDSLKSDLVVTAYYDNGTTAPVNNYSLSGDLTVGTSVVTVAYGGKTTTFNVTVSAPTREMLFGMFTDGYGTIKANSAASYPSLGKHCYRSTTTARATSQTPFANANKYIFTVTDSAKYNLLVDDVTSIEPVSTPLITQAVDGVSYHAGDKTVSWKTSDSVTTDYGWIGLKKMDGTAFTAEELANGAEAVFTYTEVQ